MAICRELKKIDFGPSVQVCREPVLNVYVAKDGSCGSHFNKSASQSILESKFATSTIMVDMYEDGADIVIRRGSSVKLSYREQKGTFDLSSKVSKWLHKNRGTRAFKVTAEMDELVLTPLKEVVIYK